MNKSEQKIKTNMRNYILALVLLLLTNIITSYTLVYVAHGKLHSQIEKRMLDIANTAADGVKGDFLADYHGTEDEKSSEGYQYSMFVLNTIFENIDLSYIYCVRCEGNDKFVYILDPDKVSPAEFGQEISVTEALRTAQSGVPAVDSKPHSDEWGSFYSAYSPVFDSNGKVVSIIGVDFDFKQHDEIIKTFNYIAMGLIAFAIAIGIILAIFIMTQNRKRMSTVMENIKNLESEMVKLDDIIVESSVKKLDMLPKHESVILKTLASGEVNNEKLMNEYDALNMGVDSVLIKLKRYLKYIDNNMYTDDTTGTNNKAAYKLKIKELDDEITAGNADFSVAFFDINGIKRLYVHYGFETGEEQMFECSKLLITIFGRKNIYHITGDEFIVLIKGKSRFDMEDLFTAFDKEIEKYNADHVNDHILSVAKGFETYDAEKHSNYRSVFTNAKQNCDKDKENYYKADIF